ncbi:MAG: serine/threonine-protein kinase [Actinomycetota bacterium]
MSAKDQRLVQEALPTYEVLGELGRGAFGIVYEARHSQLGRSVAVKQLGRTFATDDSVRERFIAEAQTVAGLDHPHIVPVYDFVDGEDGLCLIIMERCAGSVGERFTGSGLETDEACAAILACCAALDFAHRAGVLHRDIKPENLLYDTRGLVKLGDFGIARAIDTDARRTATGTVIGTPAYMSPEQVRGEDLTPASDVYSVGIMAYELLTGRFPFEDITSATGLLAHHLVTPPTPLIEARAELPAGLGEVIDRALSKEAADRPATALDLASELTRACVSAFGTGWVREGDFVLHWPAIIAESERQTGGAAKQDTIVVRADESRTLLAGGRGPALDASDPGLASPGGPAHTGTVQYTPPSTTGASAKPPGAVAATSLSSQGASPPAPSPPAPTNPTAPNWAPPGDTASGVTPPAGPATGGAPVAPLGFVGGGGTGTGTGVGPASTGASSGGTSKGLKALFAVLAFIGFVFVALVIIGLLVGDPDDEAVTTTDGDTTEVTSGAADGDGAGDDEPLGADTAFQPPITPVPAVAPAVTVDSPFTPTPCPVEQERIACIIAVAIDEDGEMLAAYEVFGFVPELEPVDYHLHFYLDTAVDGDERKAGTEVPGGSWRPWDGILPFTTSGGENGRIGFTQADVEAAGARHLCVIVADPEQRAIPGSGNCAPIPYTWDDTVALQQVDRLLGVYAGRCAIGATVIMPEGWQWVDLVATSPEEAARILRPGNVAEVTPIYQQLVDSGTVMLGDGPVDGDYIVNFTVWRVEGNFTSADDPATVESELNRAGLFFDTPPETRTLAGRDVNSQVVVGDGFEFTQYVVPDFGYALVLDFFSPNAERWRETSDAVAATLMGC